MNSHEPLQIKKSKPALMISSALHSSVPPPTHIPSTLPVYFGAPASPRCTLHALRNEGRGISARCPPYVWHPSRAPPPYMHTSAEKNSHTGHAPRGHSPYRCRVRERRTSRCALGPARSSPPHFRVLPLLPPPTDQVRTGSPIPIPHEKVADTRHIPYPPSRQLLIR